MRSNPTNTALDAAARDESRFQTRRNGAAAVKTSEASTAAACLHGSHRHGET